jgi:Uma2 family endonuclease
MSVSTATKRETAQEASSDQVVCLNNMTWGTYKWLDDRRGHQPGTRFTFSEGVLQIMAVGFEHEWLNRFLAQIVELLGQAFRLNYENAGGITLRREDREKGFEPDTCFYFANAARIRGKKEISLAIDPPPDLMIEIDITSSSLNRLPIFASAGVPEVWRYQFGTLTMYALNGESYRVTETSLTFPSVTPAQITSWLSDAQTMLRLEWIDTMQERLRQIVAEQKHDQ